MPDRRVWKKSAALRRVVSANIIRLRNAKDWSQEKLAEEADVHRTYVGMVESGERNITLGTLQMFADALGVAPIELLTKRRS